MTYQAAYNQQPREIKKLAYGLFQRLSWGEWNTLSAASAMAWIDRLQAAQPKTAEDFAAALVNFDYMQAEARSNYHHNKRERSKIDAAFAFWAEAA